MAHYPAYPLPHTVNGYAIQHRVGPGEIYVFEHAVSTPVQFEGPMACHALTIYYHYLPWLDIPRIRHPEHIEGHGLRRYHCGAFILTQT